jgi:hypothetical protein
MDELLTTDDMMRIWNCSKSTLDRYEEAGIIPSRLVLRRDRHGRPIVIRWRKADVMRKLAELPAQSPNWTNTAQ